MAGLEDGRRYGLTSQERNNDKKILVFVKLTDSALKAIEYYLSLRGNNRKQPSIQFQGSQGSLTIPSTTPGTDHSFEFNYSPTSESESLQGSFDCVQKSGSRSLESLGSMLYKMHVLAKDDVYQATRFRMAAAEEESKKNCTKVIKATGPYMSKKVKVKKPAPMPPKPPPTSPPYLSSKPSSLSSLSSSTSSSSSSTPLSSAISKTSVNGHSNGAPSNYSNSSNQGKLPKPPGNPDIYKRSYRERIIHLLALRPYKKPELLARLMKDGIKEKDKKSLTSILSQVAVLRDNSYNLARHIWNEVQEDWPFYSEADKQLMKRRKPQNLTPPAEVEQLPPPASISGSSQSFGQKRPLGGSQMAPSVPKRQRISHYNKPPQPEIPTSGNVNVKLSEYSQVTVKTDSSYEVNQPKREVNGYNSGYRTDHNNSSSKTDSHGVNGYHSNHHNNYSNGDHKHESGGPNLGKSDSLGFVTSSHNGYSKDYKDNNNTYSNTYSNGYSSGHAQNSYNSCNGKYSTSSALCSGSTGGSDHSTPSSSPDCQDADSRGPDSNGDSMLDFPDHLKKYTIITNPEQRAQYKADFNSDYELYREAHRAIERVSKRFSELEERLRNTEDGSEDRKRIQEEVLRAYKENKKNQVYQDAKKKFNRLHQKLSHIKKLVLEYDNAQMCNS